MAPAIHRGQIRRRSSTTARRPIEYRKWVDGHHRAIALIELGVTFTFHWYWIRLFGVGMEHDPFPYHLLGS